MSDIDDSIIEGREESLTNIDWLCDFVRRKCDMGDGESKMAIIMLRSVGMTIKEYIK